MTKRLIAGIACLALMAAAAPAREGRIPGPSARSTPQAKSGPKAVRRAATKRPRNKGEAPALVKTYAAMPADERLAIQSNLAWTGYYDGPPGGTSDDGRLIDAVKLFQKALKDKDTGVLDDEQRGHLAAAAEPHQQTVGWRVIDDPRTGARFGLPEKLVSPLGGSRTGDTWISGHGQVRIESFRLNEASLPALFDEERKTPRGRYATSRVLAPDSFVISGTQGLKNFVVRAQSSGAEIRGITILYDQAMTGIMASVAVAVANSFQGFPDPNTAPLPGQRRAVEYSTALVVDRSGDLITAGQGAAGCEALIVPGFGHAVRIAEDNTSDLALIRLYGGRNLLPAALAGDYGKGEGDNVTLVGIADPAAQPTSGLVTKATAHLDGQALAPAPDPGFSGAAVLDAQGRFVGMVDLRSAAVAGTGAPTWQATLVPAATVRDFLSAHGITPVSSGDGPIDQSVVRVICVRK